MGILASILSALFATSKDIVSKKLSTAVDSSVSTFSSFFFALPFYCVLLLLLYLLGVENFAFSLAFIHLVILRAVTDVFAEWLKMKALSTGDLSLVSLFLSLSPLFMLITSPLITGDHLSTTGIGAMLLIIAGSTLIVYRPSLHNVSHNRAILLACGSALFFSLNSCFDRLAVQNASPTLSGFAMTALSAFFLAPLVIFSKGRRAQVSQERRNFLLRGFFEVAFMVSKLYALSYLPAPYVAGLQRISLLFSIVGGRMFFGEEDFARRIIAGLLVVIGVTCIILYH